jgi:hypothetical protein
MALSKFIDVDFSTPPEGYSNGVLLSSFDELMAAAQPLRTLVKTLTWEEIEAACALNHVERNNRGLVVHVFNQSVESACVGNGFVGGCTLRGRLQFGESYPICSPMSVYKEIAPNANSGAYLPDAVRQITTIGYLPLPGSGYEHEHPATGYRNPLPKGWETTAGEFFMATSILTCQGAQEIATATASGFPVVIGRQGHCVYSLFPVKDGSKWHIAYVNSWGSWGDVINDKCGRGLGYDSERTLRDVVGYAICGVKVHKRNFFPAAPAAL